MTRKTISILKNAVMLFVVFALGVSISNVNVSHAERKSFNIEQAVGNAPNIIAWINGEKVSEKAKFRASFKKIDRDFETEEVIPFKKTKDSVRYVVFLDNSKSVDEAQFEEVKKQLVSVRNDMRKSDKMELYTVGADTNRGNCKTIFKTIGKSGKQKDIEKIKKIKRDKNFTVLYRSLTKKLTTIDNSSERTILLVITDGEDDSSGKDKENYNVNPAVAHSKVPLYGVLMKNIIGRPDNKKIKNTKKNILNDSYSRGYYRDCASVKDVKKGFKTIKKIVFDETYTVKFKAADGSNRTLSESESKLGIVMEKGGKTWEAALDKEGQFSYTNSQPDNDSPEIKKIEKSGSNSIKVKIADGTTKRLLNADNVKNYIVKYDGNKGKIWEISGITADDTQDSYTIIFKDKLYSGKYTIECKNITDDSLQKNKISEKAVSFEIKDGLNGTVETLKATVKAYWWILLIVIIAVCGIITVLVIRKRPQQVVEVKNVDTKELLGADSKLIRLTITDKYGSVQDIDINVEGSIFVGRSDICNIYFDDDVLSKQHFVIEVTKMACYIEDLQTTNSTFVNGVKITGRRRLLEGDVITAGKEKFEFHSVANGGDQ